MGLILCSVFSTTLMVALTYASVARPRWSQMEGYIGAIMASKKTKKQDNKRSSRLYVDKQVQGTLARRVIFHFLMFIAVGAMVGLFLQFLSDPFKPLRLHISAFWSQTGPYVIAMLCMLPVFMKDTISLTHKMAGPIVRLRGHIRSISEGEDVAPLKFRDGDFFDDLPEMFNRMMERLEGNIDQEEIDALIEKAANVVGAEDTAEHDMVDVSGAASQDA